MPDKTSSSISRTTYWLMCSTKARHNEKLTQSQIIEQSLDFLQKKPNGL